MTAALACAVVLAGACGDGTDGDDRRSASSTAATMGFSVFFEVDAAKDHIDAVRAELEGRDPVRSVVFVDRAAAHAEFSEMFADDPEMVASVSPEELPESFRVEVELGSLDAVVAAVEDMPGVREVVVDKGSSR